LFLLGLLVLESVSLLCVHALRDISSGGTAVDPADGVVCNLEEENLFEVDVYTHSKICIEFT